MANIKIELYQPVIDGQVLTFKAPCDCVQVTGIKVDYKEGDETTSTVFSFVDAHGQELAGLGNLFTAGAMVKVILDTDENKAYIQNADTNSYLENRLRYAAPVNLLDNSNFRNPVNQRGVRSGLSYDHQYFIDRWKIYGSGADFDLDGSDGNLLIGNDGSATCGIYQRIEASRLTPGKTYTLAAKVMASEGSDNECFLSYSNAASAAGEYIVGSKGIAQTDDYIIATFDFTLVESTDGFYNFRLRTIAKQAHVYVDWIALYEGQYTPETLPEYHPKGYAAELLECQRYYYRVEGEISWVGYKSSITHAFVAVPTQMRATPTVVASWFRLRGTKDSDKGEINASGVTISAGYGNNYRLTLKDPGLANEQPILCITSNLELSADL